jgi:type III restriction enzyme
MKLKFKVQSYQTSAVESVVDCFAGQVNTAGITYRIDPGVIRSKSGHVQAGLYEMQGFKNADVQLTGGQLLENIHAVQRRQNLSLSTSLDDFYVKDARRDAYIPVKASYRKQANAICPIHLDVEMETLIGSQLLGCFNLSQKRPRISK